MRSKAQNLAFSIRFLRIEKDMLVAAADMTRVKDRYTAAFASRRSDWIRTPAIVVSWDTVEVQATGGHNVDSKVTDFQLDRTLPPEGFRVIEEQKRTTVYHGEALVGRENGLNQALRKWGLTGGGDVDALADAFRQEVRQPKPPVREASEALLIQITPEMHAAESPVRIGLASAARPATRRGGRSGRGLPGSTA